MEILKNSDVRPYFIFIAPGSIAKLKEMRQQQGATVTVTCTCTISLVELRFGSFKC